MKKLKDIFYNKNDILVALLIVAIAALVISNRIDSILSYPSSLEAQAAISASNQPPSPPVQYVGKEDSEDGDTNAEGNGQEGTGTSGEAIGTDVPPQNPGTTNPPAGEQPSNPPDSTQPVNHSVYIAPGSTAAQIADVLISVKLFETRQAFFDAVSAASADTKLKAGTFTIPSTATPDQVVTILTK